MGEPIVDLDGTRLDRQIQRARSQSGVRAMYGTSDYTEELIRRVRLAARGRTAVDGHVVYDVEPVEFDDLIEIRTGGDRSVMTALRTQERGGDLEIPWVSFWPLSNMDEDAILAGWEEALRAAADAPHDVCVEVNSMLESALTFDFGYVAWRQDTGPLRRMTSTRFHEELRERYRARQIARDGVVPRARLINNGGTPYTVTFTSATATPTVTGTVGFTDVTFPPPPPTQGHWRPSVDDINDMVQRMNAPETFQRYIALDDLTAAPSSTAVWADAEDQDVQAEPPFVAFTEVRTWDGTITGVDGSGRDSNGDRPTIPGYRFGLCNCDECREVRLDEADYRDPDDYPEEDDMEYDEEEA